MIKLEHLGSFNNIVNSPVLTYTKDIPNYSFIIINDCLYLIANTLTGDDSYRDDIVIPAGKPLNGFFCKSLEGENLIIDKKHVEGNANELLVDDILVAQDNGKLGKGDISNIYFLITDIRKSVIKVKVKINKNHIHDENCLIIPEGITEIEDYAYSGRNDITCVVIPNSVTSIGNCAFEYCTSLERVTIGNGVINIGERAFDSCEKLTSITFPDNIISVNEYAFDNTAWYNNQPDGVVYVGKMAYKYKGEMPENTSIEFVDGTKRINSNIFILCENLKKVIIPDSVTTIGNGAFLGCTSLEEVTMGSSVSSIEESAFYNCENLANITIPDSVTSIGYSAFGNTRIESIIIPDGVMDINGFSECRNLKSVTIPNNATSIAGSAFSDCSSLTNIIIPNSVTSIGDAAFGNCYSLTNVVIPNGVTSIGYNAFWNCKNLNSISIPNSITSIRDSAFNGLTNLKNVILKQGYNCNSYIAPNSLSTGLNFSDSELITVESLVSMLEALADRTGLESYTLVIGSVNKAKLSEEQLAVATSKNWVIE